MPNYCSNYLKIEGTENAVKELLQLVKSDESIFDFEKIIPMPDYIYRGPLGPEEEKIYSGNNWYNWSCDNWGTKWNSVGAVVNGNIIAFQTAWSPCEPVIEMLAKQFPTLCFVYTFNEIGMGFCGKRVYENGKLMFCFDGKYWENRMCDLDEEPDVDTLIDQVLSVNESGFETMKEFAL